jgi:hypothetical protein
MTPTVVGRGDGGDAGSGWRRGRRGDGGDAATRRRGLTGAYLIEVGAELLMLLLQEHVLLQGEVVGVFRRHLGGREGSSC